VAFSITKNGIKSDVVLEELKIFLGMNKGILKKKKKEFELGCRN
jgi:hypothetical protein